MIETIRTSALRVGNFTSSEIYRLMSFDEILLSKEELEARPKSGKGSKTTLKKGTGFGEGALTYIQEKKLERKLGRALNEEASSRALSWGKYVESQAFYRLNENFKYNFCSQETIIHPLINEWAGSPDGFSDDAVVEIKTPWTLKSFCSLVEAKDIHEIRENHKQGEAYYWQIVSNAILTGKDYGELVVYMPYQSELNDLRAETTNYIDPNKVAWISWSTDDEIPFLPDGGHFKNLNMIRFEIDQADKDLLTERVKLAARLLTA